MKNQILRIRDTFHANMYGEEYGIRMAGYWHHLYTNGEILLIQEGEEREDASARGRFWRLEADMVKVSEYSLSFKFRSEGLGIPKLEFAYYDEKKVSFRQVAENIYLARKFLAGGEFYHLESRWYMLDNDEKIKIRKAVTRIKKIKILIPSLKEEMKKVYSYNIWVKG